ncbi:hypothetical protein O3G_MSEX009792 [Manduca sexta]|uniref:Uncharacterized protein n=1 Tax=Manduca sexta TaxID=7130 RepID=A0A921ZEJ4_MANSE|nr:hypothetical protein O3G_MSEX009792 [Manduca sexta]
MENSILLKFILIVVLLAITTSAKHIRSGNKLAMKHNHSEKPQNNIIDLKYSKHLKKRNVYRSWSRSSSSQAYNMPPYLVFNKKLGAYYPFFKYPNENSMRRSMYKYG